MRDGGEDAPDEEKTEELILLLFSSLSLSLSFLCRRSFSLQLTVAFERWETVFLAEEEMF